MLCLLLAAASSNAPLSVCDPYQTYTVAGWGAGGRCRFVCSLKSHAHKLIQSVSSGMGRGRGWEGKLYGDFLK